MQTHRRRHVYRRTDTDLYTHRQRHTCIPTQTCIHTVTQTCTQIQRPVYSHTDLYTYTQTCTQKHRHKPFFIYKENIYCCNIMKGKHKNIANTGSTHGKLCPWLCWTLNLSLALEGDATSIIFDKTSFVMTKVCLPRQKLLLWQNDVGCDKIFLSRLNIFVVTNICCNKHTKVVMTRILLSRQKTRFSCDKDVSVVTKVSLLQQNF